MKNPEKFPQTLEDFMQIYIDYENELKKEYPDDSSMTVDYLQYSQYHDNPVTPFHNKYYCTKYNTKHSWTPYFYLTSTLIFLSVCILMSFLNVYLFGIISESILLGRFFGFIIFIGLATFLSYLFVKVANKWTWKYFLILALILLGGFYTTLQVISLFGTSSDILLDRFIVILGISWAPTSFSVFLLIKYKPYITEFGGIHLFFGWIYRISQTNGDINSLNLSFKRLIYELDNWLNKILNLIIKNKYELLEGFYYNIISNENFLLEIKNNHSEFEKIFQGLLVEDLLTSDAFSFLKKDEKIVKKLDFFNLKWLNNRLALAELPKITKLVEKLSQKNIEIIYYSLWNRFKKFKVNFVPLAVFILSTIIPLIIAIFQ